MDTKNVLMAVVLSTIIIVGWQVFVVDPELKKSKTEIVKTEQAKPSPSTNSGQPSAPSLNIKAPTPQKIVTRTEAISSVQRVKIENSKLIGSISLTGALIDDITLKNYKEDIKKNSKLVEVLSPKKMNNGYYLESGWASANNIVVPDNNSVWKLVKNNALTPKTPIELEWNNQNGIIFTKKIEIDEQYLFKISDGIKNSSKNKVDLFHYSQITRKEKPFVQGFYILHEGLIGVIDENLKEETYDNIKDKNQKYQGSKGWVGITDKYWLTAIVPQQKQAFNAEFTFNNSYKANYILTTPSSVNPGQTTSSSAQLFIGAKEVEVIDGYAKTAEINKFDLAIDWGWFYFFTKPLFFIIDYFFKWCGNFGVAIIILTAGIRLLFFPLANYSFASMAKMKALQPEMTRLKDLYKDDKQKIQLEMMALYRKEKINPVSGCLPMLIQIPFFFAIYKMLFVTLEMRHAPFFGWIQDLSAPDPTSLFNLFGLIPWSPPSFLMIGVWPILMGVTMWIQQKLNPAPTDPIQAKIFAFFPLFLTVMLASFPSGLVVYWTVNNVLTMAQQYIIIKKTKTKTV
ncbi:MAG: membrane protein insertase YidC [Pelagibacteraceae bacterium]